MLCIRIGNYEIIADTFVAACGYGPDLASAFRKISRSSIYLNKNVLVDRLLRFQHCFLQQYIRSHY